MSAPAVADSAPVVVAAEKKKRPQNEWSMTVDAVRAEMIAAGNPKPKLGDILKVASTRYVKKQKAVSVAKRVKKIVAAASEESSEEESQSEIEIDTEMEEEINAAEPKDDEPTPVAEEEKPKKKAAAKKVAPAPVEEEKKKEEEKPAL